MDSTLGKMLKVRNTRFYNTEAPLGSGKPLCSQQQTKSTLSHTGLNHKVTLPVRGKLNLTYFPCSHVWFILFYWHRQILLSSNTQAEIKQTTCRCMFIVSASVVIKLKNITLYCFNKHRSGKTYSQHISWHFLTPW